MQRLKIVAGTYGKWAHKLLPPESAQAKLLSIGLPAVPSLVDALHDPKLTAQRRAVILSLLFGLTGQNDPREARGVVAEYDSAEGPWAVSGDGGGGFGLGGTSTMTGGTIDENAQVQFAGQWETWKQFIQTAPAK